jgi:hypothetical protein
LSERARFPESFCTPDFPWLNAETLAHAMLALKAAEESAA